MMGTVVLTNQFDEPDDVVGWANGLVGNDAPGWDRYLVNNVVSMSVLFINNQYVVFAVVAVHWHP